MFIKSIMIMVHTRSNGTFEIDAGGGFFGCPPMKIILNKDGYEQKNRRNRKCGKQNNLFD